MSDLVFVKPAEGGRVRMPDRNSNVMPVEGALVPRTVYYERLIMTKELEVDEAKTKEAIAARDRQVEEASKPPAAERPADQQKPAAEAPRSVPRPSK